MAPRRGADERLVAAVGDVIISRKSFLRSKTTFELALDAEIGLLYSHRVAVRRKKQKYHVPRSTIITMDTELKIVVGDVQRQIAAISTWETKI